VNADFDLFATSDQAGRCIVRRVADDVEVAQLPPAKRPRMIIFGADRWLADVDHLGARTVRIWDVAAPVPEVRVDDQRAMASLDFRPDGGLVAILHADGSLTTHELPSGKKRHDLPPRPIAQESAIRLHPSLPFVVLTSVFAKSASLISLDTGHAVGLELPWPDGGTIQGEWSDDGRSLAIPGSHAQGVAFYEFAGDPPVARLLRKIEGITTWLSHIALNRSGDRLFSRGDNNSTVMTDLISRRVLIRPPAFIALPMLPPTLKIDRGRRRLFPARVDDPVRRFGYWSVAEGQECRLIVPDNPRLVGRWAYISPDGRMGIGLSGENVLFFDIERGREVGSISFKDSATRSFYVELDPSGCLLTNTFGGCFRWPIRPDPTTPGSVLIGPPERLRLTPWENKTSQSLDGKIISQAIMGRYPGDPQAGGWLLRNTRREPARNLHSGIPIGNTSVTLDGRWVVFGGAPGPVYVHDVETGKEVWSMPGQHGRCVFSPDGKWLGTDIDNGRLFEVGTWRPGPQLGPGYLACFSPDSTLAVLSTVEGPYRLVEVATGHEIARFQDPDDGNDEVALSKDNATLFTIHKDGMRVWDLRLIRSELSKIGLDWDAPTFPPRPKPEGPLTVKIVGADLLDPKSAASRVQRVLTSLLSGSGTDAVLASADELIQSGWHGLGLAAYDAGIRHYPAMDHLRMHRGMELFRRGRWEAAAEDFRLASAGKLPCKFRGQARIRMAWAYHELGRHADAASTLAKELEAPADTRKDVDQAGLRLLLAEFFDLDGKPDLAGREREAAAALHARPAEAANNLAWEWLVLKARSTLGDNERNVPTALLLARKAVELEPGEAMYGNTYGLALYRSERIAEAKSALEANLMLGKDTMDAWDLFPLAMCQHRLGDRKAARDSYDKAVIWMKGHADKLLGDARELADLQAEAGRLVGVTN
jgi:Tfp pilus assembly protein PilF/WD40 repeat protein